MGAPAGLGSWAYEPLTPTSFLHRSAAVHPDRTAVVDGDLRFTYGELRQRCMQLAGSLPDLAAGRPVAVLAPNSRVLFGAHHAVPWSGSPLVATALGRRTVTPRAPVTR